MIPRSDSDNPFDKIAFGLMVAIGGEDASDTIALLQKQEAITRRELEAIPLRAQERGEKFLAYSAESREALLECLTQYLEWIEATLPALQNFDSSGTVQAYEKSQEILPRLNEVVEAYSQQFASFGPHNTLPCNTLARVLDGIANGEIAPEAWSQYCTFYADSVKEKSEHLMEISMPGFSYLKNGYQQALDLFDSVSAAGAGAGHESIAALDDILTDCIEMEERMVRAGAGETEIPATNMLLLCLQDWIDDKLTKENLSIVVEDYADIMDGYAETFEDAASKPTDSALVKEEIPRTLDAMDTHFSAVEDLSEGLDDLDKETALELAERLKDTAGQLAESKEVYATAAKHQNHTACPICGRSNPPENRNCEACGETLPRPEDAGMTGSSTFSMLSGPMLEEHGQLEMTENVAELFTACDDVADGNIDNATFLKVLQNAAAGLNEFILELEGAAATATDENSFSPEGWEEWKKHHLPYMEDIAAAYQAGITETQEGLRSMEAFISEPEESHLIEGVRLVWQGLSAINRARQSIETHAKMLDGFYKENQQQDGMAT